MASNNSEINAAINEATMALRALHPEDSERLLDAAYAKRGLTRRKRLSPEAKAARDLAEKQAKAQAKIDALAEAAGLRVIVASPATTVTMAASGMTEEEIAAEQRYREAMGTDQSLTMSTLVIPE